MERKATIWIVMGVIAWMAGVSCAGVMEITEWMYKGVSGDFVGIGFRDHNESVCIGAESRPSAPFGWECRKRILDAAGH